MHVSLLVAACLVSAASTSLGAIGILRARGRWGLVAHEDGRAIGGPALIIGVIIGTTSTVTIDLHLAIGVIIVVLVGAIDDLTDLSPWQKLAGQVIAAGIAAAGLASQIHSAPIPPALIGMAAFLWIVFLTNAANLIDGLDGLLIGTTVPGMLVLMIISISTGDLFATVLAGACTASLLAFLPFNWARARLLLGDTGSEFIGFSLAVISVISFLHRPRVSSIPIFFLIAAIPFTDTAFAIIRRTVHHRSIFAGDREHIHHRLARRIGEKRSVAFLSLLAILSSTVAYVLWNAGM